MKKTIAALFALSVYGCTASAPAIANMNEMFWFPETPGKIQEFSDENGTYKSVLSSECADPVTMEHDDCLGLLFNAEYWIIDAARSDHNILMDGHKPMIMLNGLVKHANVIRAGTSIVIRRDENPEFNPIGKVLSVNTPYGKGEFVL
ncbi:hypothetical protein FDI46_gp200 [Aeromonas phage AS-gz]|uniref:Lipoprotein n=1 Tax=Aeromonas phage AS-gz TaxID=2026082 RepID=A0A223LFP6_9CAUD|nr:hypothetical protein FDI46_gp200 [Aeromonas phage AS-gz]ASU00736.1 hypothetical protein [Aeromonas phage AS-gz]